MFKIWKSGCLCENKLVQYDLETSVKFLQRNNSRHWNKILPRNNSRHWNKILPRNNSSPGVICSSVCLNRWVTHQRVSHILGHPWSTAKVCLTLCFSVDTFFLRVLFGSLYFSFFYPSTTRCTINIVYYWWTLRCTRIIWRFWVQS